MQGYTGVAGGKNLSPELSVSNGIIISSKNRTFPSLYGSVIQAVNVGSGLASTANPIVESGDISLPIINPLIESLGVVTTPSDGSDPQLKTYLPRISVDQYGKVDKLTRIPSYSGYSTLEFALRPGPNITTPGILCTAHIYDGLVSINIHAKLLVTKKTSIIFYEFPTSIIPSKLYKNLEFPMEVNGVSIIGQLQILSAGQVKLSFDRLLIDSQAQTGDYILINHTTIFYLK